MSQEVLRQPPEGKQFIQFLNQIESDIRPESCRFEAFNYWPIIRFAINAKRAGKALKGEGDLPTVTEVQRQKLRLIRLLGRPFGVGRRDGALRVRKPSYPKNYFSHLQQADVLFLNKSTQYNNHLSGYAIQFFTDGLRHIAGDGATCATLVDRDPRRNGERFWVDTIIMPPVKGRNKAGLLKPSTVSELELRDHIITKVGEINAAIKSRGVDCRINEKFILERISKTLAHVDYFELLLQQVRPKVIYLSSFTGAYHVCVAARRQGITVVDIQHGGMHRNHPLAAHWIDVPEGGYELLPDVFWCWSPRSAEYIASTFSQGHKAVVGGNPKEAFEKSIFQTETGTRRASNDQTRVLVALQYGKGAIVAPHVKQAYLRTRDKVDWLFRLHPRGFDRLEDVVRELGIPEEDVRRASERPLHQLLPDISCMLTDASTIVYEALNHGVKSAVWSRKGTEFFDDLMESGKISYLSDDEEVIRFVTSRDTQAAEDQITTVNNADVSDPQIIRSHFNALLKA